MPPHLRYEGKLRNLNFTRREACVIINDIWLERHEYLNTRVIKDGKDVADLEPLSQFMIAYFKRRHPSEQTAFEYSYNLNESLEKYPQNELISFFLAVLNFEVIFKFSGNKFHLFSLS